MRENDTQKLNFMIERLHMTFKN